MKLTKILLGLSAAALMASCSNEIPGNDSGQITENETTTFVRISLVGDLNTRAAEYENGTADENEVKELLLTFFDAGRN